MHHFITGRDEPLKRWAAPRIPHIGEADRFGPSVAVGVATGPKADDQLLAVIVFHDFHPKYGICQISVAAANPRWAVRRTLKGLLSIPFLQYECNKVWVSMPHTSDRVIGFVKAIGFVQEAVLRDHFGKGVHAVICRMMRGDYERVYWPDKTAKKAA